MITYTEGEKAATHLPKISAPDKVKVNEVFEVRVYVEGHPNKPEHSIKWLELYLEEEGREFNPVMVARAAFSEYSSPDITIKVKLGKKCKLIAIAYCNKHGLWESVKEIEVE